MLTLILARHISISISSAAKAQPDSPKLTFRSGLAIEENIKITPDFTNWDDVLLKFIPMPIPKSNIATGCLMLVDHPNPSVKDVAGGS